MNYLHITETILLKGSNCLTDMQVSTNSVDSDQTAP